MKSTQTKTPAVAKAQAKSASAQVKTSAKVKTSGAKKAAVSSKAADAAKKALAAKAEAKRLAAAKAAEAAKSAKKSAPVKDVKKASVKEAPKAPVASAKQAAKPVAAAPKAKAPSAVEPVVAKPVPKSAPAIASGSTVPQTKVGIVTQKKAQPAASVQTQNEPVARPTIVAAGKPAAARIEVKAQAKPGTHRTGFKSNEFIVYPAHGVGQIVAIEEQEVAGFKLELFVISFAKDKMTLKVPLPKVLNGAIRKLADSETVNKALDTLTGRARIKRTMWSRRAQEYEAKINSGDLGSIAEVVRDLYRSDAQPEQSYSERQLYEAALDRMAREVAAVNKIIENEALKLIETNLQRGPRRGAKSDGAADSALGVEIGEAA